MSEQERTGPNAPLVLVGGNAHPALAQQLAKELGVAACQAEVGAFADGETRACIRAELRGARVVLLQPTAPPVNDHLMVLALLADAARASGAAQVIAVVPYFGYARQERRPGPGHPRSAQVVARLLGAVGIDHLVTLDLHAPALESALPMPVTELSAEDVFLPVVRGWGLTDLTVVAPDAGALKRAQRYATALRAGEADFARTPSLGVGLAVVTKERPRPDAVVTFRLLGDVTGRACLVVDDLVSTGHTLVEAATALRQQGARAVHTAFTHAVLAPGALDRVTAAFDRVLTTDSIASPASPRLQVINLAPLLAGALRRLGA